LLCLRVLNSNDLYINGIVDCGNDCLDYQRISFDDFLYNLKQEKSTRASQVFKHLKDSRNIDNSEDETPYRYVFLAVTSDKYGFTAFSGVSLSNISLYKYSKKKTSFSHISGN
jgi:hypothetical protein